MNISDSLNILSSRQQNSTEAIRCSCCELEKCFYPLTPDVTTETILEQKEMLELLNLFSQLQGERIQVHEMWNLFIHSFIILFMIITGKQSNVTYDESLKILIAEKKVKDYPYLCAETTSRFSIISSKIIAIKVM